MKKYIIIFALLLAAVSCQKEDVAAPGRLVFTAQISDAAKVVENGGKMTWEPGDVIRISNGTSWEDVTLSASDITADGYSATFAVSLSEAAQYYAVYPAANCGSGLTVSEGNVTVSVPTDQTPENVFTCVASCPDANRLFAFKHPSALIYFYTTNSSISRLVFHANGGQAVAGPLSVDPSTGESVWGGSTSDDISVAVSSEGKAWLEIAPLETLTTGFSVYAYNASDALLGIVYKNASRQFVQNTRYTLDRPNLTASAAEFDGYAYTSLDNALAAFNAKGNGTLTWDANASWDKTFTAENGTLNLNGHTHSGCFYLQNQSGTITICNGTISGTDGASGFNDSFGGKIILENLTITGTLWTDGHEFEIRSGTYGQINNTILNSAPTSGLITIKGGFFKNQFNHNPSSGWSKGSFLIEGGKFKYDPTASSYPVTIAAGKSVQTNTDSDAATYPYVVKDTPETPEP